VACRAPVQALLVLRWFKDATKLRILALDAGISIATAYRYLHEAIDVIAARTPELPDVLARAKSDQWPYLCLDGTPIPATKIAARAANASNDPAECRTPRRSCGSGTRPPIEYVAPSRK
jgi:hypothetical protein